MFSVLAYQLAAYLYAVEKNTFLSKKLCRKKQNLRIRFVELTSRQIHNEH